MGRQDQLEASPPSCLLESKGQERVGVHGWDRENAASNLKGQPFMGIALVPSPHQAGQQVRGSHR